MIYFLFRWLNLRNMRDRALLEWLISGEESLSLVGWRVFLHSKKNTILIPFPVYMYVFHSLSNVFCLKFFIHIKLISPSQEYLKDPPSIVHRKKVSQNTRLFVQSVCHSLSSRFKATASQFTLHLWPHLADSYMDVRVKMRLSERVSVWISLVSEYLVSLIFFFFFLSFFLKNRKLEVILRRTYYLFFTNKILLRYMVTLKYIDRNRGLEIYFDFKFFFTWLLEKKISFGSNYAIFISNISISRPIFALHTKPFTFSSPFWVWYQLLWLFSRFSTNWKYSSLPSMVHRNLLSLEWRKCFWREWEISMGRGFVQNIRLS